MPPSLYLKIIILISLLFGCDNKPSIKETYSEENSISNIEPFSATTLEVKENNGFIGSKQCADCHKKEFEQWQGSHHDLAMQKATERTLLGDFDGAEFEYFGIVYRFHKSDGDYFVRTLGPDGVQRDYRVAYTFGVYPLQQYLVEFPGGRLQALTIAWDSRSKSEGGQRWFHLHPEAHTQRDDRLHWSGLNYNWNFMCADCHSTGVQKRYQLSNHSYDTSWSEIDVGCEACHGPGARHREWALNPDPSAPGKGLSVTYGARKKTRWIMDMDSGTAALQGAAVDTQVEIETCAPCHGAGPPVFRGQ